MIWKISTNCIPPIHITKPNSLYSTDHKSNSFCWLHSQFAVRNRSALKLHDLQFCVQQSVHSPDADTTWRPEGGTLEFPRPHVVAIACAQIIRIFVAEQQERRLQVKCKKKRKKNYCLAFLFAFYCCHFPPIVLPFIHFYFGFPSLSFSGGVIKFLARSYRKTFHTHRVGIDKQGVLSAKSSLLLP